MATKRRVTAGKRSSTGSSKVVARKKAVGRKGAVVRKPATGTRGPTRQKFDAELALIGKRLDALAKKAGAAQAGARVQYEKQIKALKVKQLAAQKALQRFGRQSAAASGPLKAGLRKAWKDIDNAVRQATRRFRETS